MTRVGIFRVTAPAVALAVLAGACQRDAATIGLVMRTPAGLLDNATAVELEVIDGDQASCDPATGRVTGDPSSDAVQSFELEHGGCSGGASWCKTITLDKDGSDKVFSIEARAGSQPIAQGCATATIDQDPLEVVIKAYRFNPPKCCNDGVLQPGEQCDTAIPAPTDCSGNSGPQACLGIIPDQVCECDCAAKEILLTTPGTGPMTSNAVGTKSELQLAFAGANGSADVAGSLRAVYTDTDSQAASDINLRLLRPDLYPVSDTLNKQLRLPECSKIFSAIGRQRDQKQPAIATISSSISAVAFASDEVQPTIFGIYVSPQGPDGCADTSTSPIVQVNAATSESAELPAIAAGPDGIALVVWNAGGNLRGRIWKASAPADLAPANSDIQIGSIASGARPRVAGNANGWVVVYTGGAGVLMNTVSTAASVGGEKSVNQGGEGPQDEPDVAMQSDGSFVVVWRAADGIAFQRYDSGGTAVAGDQDQPLTVQSPPASEPAVAASGGTGEFYAVAWTANDGTIWSRFIGTSGGFGFNSVDGQNGDYLASHPAVAGQRSQPAVAVGASGFVAIGWLDGSADHYGLYARRFPLPDLGGAL